MEIHKCTLICVRNLFLYVCKFCEGVSSVHIFHNVYIIHHDYCSMYMMCISLSVHPRCMFGTYRVNRIYYRWMDSLYLVMTSIYTTNMPFPLKRISLLTNMAFIEEV